jgi:hypothetical protein
MLDEKRRIKAPATNRNKPNHARTHATSSQPTPSTTATTSMSASPQYLTVVGGGNSTPIMAALAKAAGFKVAILTRRPKDWSKEVGFVNEDPGYIQGKSELRTAVDLITDDASLCIPQSDIIFLAGVPVHHNESILANLAKHVSKARTVFIGSICAYGGFNWVASRALGALLQLARLRGH